MTSRRILLRGGRVFTSDPDRLWAEAVVVDDAHIVYVGDERAASDIAGEDAERIDLRGGIAMPGFVDAHAHLLMTGAALLKAQLRTAGDLAEIQRRLIDWAAANPSARRVLGISWLFDAVPGRTPTKEMLDAIIDDRPVYLDANDLHSTWVNSAALTELGITDDTPDPIGGRIVRDPVTGKATGHLLENATVDLVWPLLADVDETTRDSHLAATLRAYNETGVTTSVDMALERQSLAAMQRAATAGTLSVRVVGHWLVHRCADPADELAQVRVAARMAAEQQSDLLRVAGIKIIVDGTIDGCTAALIEPYTTGANADPIWDAESLQRVVVAADAAGLQIALHAIGDRAVRIAIDALEIAARTNPARERRHRIEHLEYVDEADVSRLAPLGITASMQPVHIDPAIYSNWGELLGDPRAQRGFAWREFLSAGTTLAFGTDTPTAPHEPLHNMYIAATRKSPGDPTLTPHRPDNALPLDEAVVHATRDAAWASFLEDRVGMLREGMFADVIVLEVDPFAAAPEALLTARVVRTLLGGRTVHMSA
jgi:predicted amidohydrolase YtcJ